MAKTGSARWIRSTLKRRCDHNDITTLIRPIHQRTLSSRMGGPGSGGYKNAPGDTETHAAWDVVEQGDGSTQVCACRLRPGGAD
jgi:hypothetical protein